MFSAVFYGAIRAGKNSRFSTHGTRFYNIGAIVFTNMRSAAVWAVVDCHGMILSVERSVNLARKRRVIRIRNTYTRRRGYEMGHEVSIAIFKRSDLPEILMLVQQIGRGLELHCFVPRID